MYKVVYWEDTQRYRLDVNATNTSPHKPTLRLAQSFAHEWRKSGRAADIYLVHTDRSVSLIDA